MGLANLRKAFGDDRIHVFAGHVVTPPGEPRHFYVNAEKNVVVFVEMNHHGTPVRANLATQPGVWTVPDVNDEVLVATDNGEFEGELYIVGVIPVTNRANALAPGTLSPQTFNIVVTGDANIVVGPGSSVHLISDTKIEAAHAVGSGKSLGVEDEIHALWRYIKNQFATVTGHTHTVVGGATTTTTESGALGADGSAPEPHGTTIFKAE